METKDLMRMKQDVDESHDKLLQMEALAEHQRTELREEFGCTDSEEAETTLKQLRQQRDDLNRQIEETKAKIGQILTDGDQAVQGTKGDNHD